MIVDVLGQGGGAADLAWPLLWPQTLSVGNLSLHGSPLVLTEGHGAFLLLQRKPWLGTELD